MKINEIIVLSESRRLITETPEEIHTIREIAVKIAKIIKDQTGHFNIRLRTVVSREYVENLKSQALFDMIMKTLIVIDPRWEKQAGTTLGLLHTNEGDLHEILIRSGRSEMELVNTLVHELTHGLDLIKSKNRSFRTGTFTWKHPKDWDQQDIENYTRDPMELNARFSEFADQITYMMINARQQGKVMSTDNDMIKKWIKQSLGNANITRDIFVKGIPGDKAYNRFLSRAIMFYQFMKPIIWQNAPAEPVEKSTIKTWIQRAMDKVKNYFSSKQK